MPPYTYTFCVNYRSGTYLCQISSESHESALKSWMQSEEAVIVSGGGEGGDIHGWTAALRHQLESWQIEEVLVPIKDLANCWATHFLANDESVFIDIIKTDIRT